MNDPVEIPNDPRAVVTRVGRWRYRIAIHDGIGVYGPDGHGWHRFGRRRAAGKAERELRRYLTEREPETFEVRAEPQAR